MSVVVLISSNLSMSGDDRGVFLELFIGGIIVLFLDRQAILKTGILAALRSKKHSHAVLSTLLRVMAPPWAAGFLMIFVISNRAKSAWDAAVLFTGWFLFSIVNDVFDTSFAALQLRKGIRTLVSEPGPSPRAEPAPPVIATLAPLEA
jgi:hypothetical protein